MSLSEEDRKTLVSLEQEKAHTFLEQADEMYKQRYWDIASNRYYYACFHAVQALLIRHGLSVRTHDGLITTFGLHFVKTGKVESRMGAFLSRMEQLRKKGDYNCIYTVSEEEISTMSAPARDFIKKIDELLSE